MEGGKRGKEANEEKRIVSIKMNEGGKKRRGKEVESFQVEGGEEDIMIFVLLH